VASVQIKNVPDDVRDELHRRARSAGQSLQEYLLAHLIEEANTAPLDEVLARAAGHRGGSAPMADVAELVRRDRDQR